MMSRILTTQQIENESRSIYKPSLIGGMKFEIYNYVTLYGNKRY